MAKTDLETLVISVSADIRQMQRQMEKAVKISGTSAKKIERDFTLLDRSLGRMGAGLKSFGAGLIGGFGAQQLMQIVRQAAAAGAAIGDLSEQIGMSVEQIQILQHAANQTGSSTEQMNAALKQFATLTAKAATEGGDLADVLDANGVSIKGNANLFEDYLRLIRDAPSDIERLRLVTLGFGKGNDELLNTFREGPGVLQRWGASLERIGGPATKKTIDALGRLDDKFAETMTAISNTTLEMVGIAEPAIIALADTILVVVDLLRDFMRTLELLGEGEFAKAFRLGITGSETPTLDQLTRQLEDNLAIQEATSQAAARNVFSQEAAQLRLNDLKKEQLRLEQEIYRLQHPADVTVHPQPTTPTIVRTEDAKDAAKDMAKAAEDFREALEAGSDFAKSLSHVPEQWQKLFFDAAKAFRIDPNMLATVAWQESRFNPNAVSPAGARGLMQFMPGTAADFGINPMVPEQAVPAAAKYFRQLLDRYHGDIVLALAAYNWGMGNVDAWVAAGRNPAAMPAETRGYIAAITTPTTPTKDVLTDFGDLNLDNLAAIQAAVDRLNEHTLDATIDQMDALREAASGVFSTILSGLRSGASAGEIFQNVLAQIADELANIAIKSLTASLFGPTGTSQPGMLGAFLAPLGSLFQRQGGGPVMPGVPYQMHQGEIFVPTVGGTVKTPAQQMGMGEVHSVIAVQPSPFFVTSVMQTSARMIAENNRTLPAYLGERQRRGI